MPRKRTPSPEERDLDRAARVHYDLFVLFQGDDPTGEGRAAFTLVTITTLGHQGAAGAASGFEPSGWRRSPLRDRAT